MSLPSAGYDTFIAPAPDGDVENFSFIRDGNLFSSEFQADIDTSEGSRARFAWDDDESEMAFDWISDDVQTDLGIVRFNSGRTVYALSSDDARRVRGYAPNTRNDAYGVSDTYGQYNAYGSSFGAYWHNPYDLEDRTGNTADLTVTGTGLAEITDGPLGNAVRISDLTSYFTTTQSVVSNGISGYTLMAWVRQNGSIISSSSLINLNGASNLSANLKTENGAVTYTTRRYSGRSATGAFTTDTWELLAGRENGGVSRDVLVNGVNVDTETTTISSFTFGSSSVALGDLSYISSNDETLDIGSAAILVDAVSDALLAYEYSQTSDNSSFWTEEGWTAGGSSGINLSGELDTTPELSGPLSVSARLSGLLDSLADLEADLDCLASLAGSIETAPEAMGPLSVAAPLAGDLSGVPESSGLLSVTARLSGALESNPEAGGTLTVSVPLSGICDALPGLTGELTVDIPGVTPLSGGLSVSSELSGQLSVKAPLAGILGAVPTFTGELTAQTKRELEGALQATAELLGALSVKVPLSGTMEGNPELEGELTGGMVLILDGAIASASVEFGIIGDAPVEYGVIAKATIKGRWES